MPSTRAVTLARLLSPVLVSIAMVAMIALPAAAAGPDGLFDGVWFIQETGPGVGPNPYYASVHQTGDAIAVILLDPIGEWIYALGTRTGSTVRGTVHFPDGEARGTFNITATSPTTLTGQSTFGGLTTPLVGTKIF